MSWLKLPEWRFLGRLKGATVPAPLPVAADRDRWIRLREMFTEEKGMEEFFGGEFDTLRNHEHIRRIRVSEDYTVSVKTKRLFATVLDRTCGKHKRLYIGAFRITLSIEPGTPVMGLANRPRAKLHTIECLSSGRHDGKKTTMYVVGGNETGGFCFGAQEGNSFVTQLVTSGEFFTLILFVMARLAHVNKENEASALREYRQVLPDGSVAQRRKPPPKERLVLLQGEWPIGEEP
ncbi:hypothetical protein IT396_02660 [Candidatus Nomurabacteria bacterium]|nr:hypothetical protein [Candidatus Nomurabacteria bacterium]